MQSDGLVVVEGEEAQEAQRSRTHGWAPATDHGSYVGTGYVEALPDDGATVEDPADAPELRFDVAFTQPGVYLIWLRAWANDGGDDTVHVTIDDADHAAAVTVQGFETGVWSWSSQRNGGRAAIAVTNPGIHTIRIWMREDGFALDRVVLTADPSFVPEEFGPPPSPRAGTGSTTPTPIASLVDGIGEGAVPERRRVVA